MRSNSDIDVVKENAAFWQEFTRQIRVMHFLGDMSEKARTTTQQAQYTSAREYVHTNFDKGARMMGDNLFGEMSLDFGEQAPGQFMWLANLVQDDKLRAPKFPEVFTPDKVQEIITHIYGAQTTVASTLEEIEPAYRKWLDFESRIKMMYKAACGLDKEWQTDGLFQLSYAEDYYRMVRRLGEYVQVFKLRLEQLQRAYDAISRIITVMEMNPAEMLTRKTDEVSIPKQQSFTGRRGFGKQ